MHRPGGDLGQVRLPSNRKDLKTVKLPGKQPCAVGFQAVYRLPVSNQHDVERLRAVCACCSCDERVSEWVNCVDVVGVRL